jgi:hypothetical protein
MVFSDTVGNLGIVEQVRSLLRVDATHYPTWKIVNSVNSWLDTVTGYAIGADRHFQWDDSNHTKLPIGTTNVVANQSDYSFLVDEQGNAILTLLRIDIQDGGGEWHKLKTLDESEIPVALDEYEAQSGTPIYYDKIADNIIRLYPKPSTNITNGLKFYFQRAGSYFVATDTTKEPGVAPLLHRGFVVAAAYDGALTLGLANTQNLFIERQREEEKMRMYFAIRNEDEIRRVVPAQQNNK